MNAEKIALVTLFTIILLTSSCIDQGGELAKAQGKIRNQIAQFQNLAREINATLAAGNASQIESFVPIAVLHIENLTGDMADFIGSTKLPVKDISAFVMQGFVTTSTGILNRAVYALRGQNKTQEIASADTSELQTLKGDVKKFAGSADWHAMKNASSALANLSWRSAIRAADYAYVDLYEIALTYKLAAITAIAGDVEAGRALLNHSLASPNYPLEIKRGETGNIEGYRLKLGDEFAVLNQTAMLIPLRVSKGDSTLYDGFFEMHKSGVPQKPWQEENLTLDNGRLIVYASDATNNSSTIIVKITDLLS
jgi:hypothetical protein